MNDDTAKTPRRWVAFNSQITPEQRQMLQEMADALGIPRSTVARMLIESGHQTMKENPALFMEWGAGWVNKESEE